MKKGIIALIIVASALTITGGVLIGVAASRGGFNSETVNHEYIKEESFSKIKIDTTVSDVTFKPSEDDKTKVVLVEKEKLYHNVTVSEDTLKITQVDELRFYEKWFGYSSGLKFTVYLPSSTYDDLNIKCNTGDIKIDDAFTFNNVTIDIDTGDVDFAKVNMINKIKVSSSTGHIKLKEFTYGTAELKTSTGRVQLKDAIGGATSINTSTGSVTLTSTVITGHLDIKCSTGDVEFTNSDATTIKIDTSTGDISGNLLTGKTFDAHSGTGHVHVPSTTGGSCEIHTSTGDIDITVSAA